MEKSILPGEENKRRYLCPICGKHTVLWLLPDTEVKNLPIKCKRCGVETVVSILPEPEPLVPAP